MRQRVLARRFQIRREQEILKIRTILLSRFAFAPEPIEADVRVLDRDDQHPVRPIRGAPDRRDRVGLDLRVAEPVELQQAQLLDHREGLGRLRNERRRRDDDHRSGSDPSQRPHVVLPPRSDRVIVNSALGAILL